MPTSTSSDDQAVLAAEERASRLRAIRQEGAQLLNLYQSVDDGDVRAAILRLVKSMSTMCGAPTPRVAEREREAEAQRARAEAD